MAKFRHFLINYLVTLHSLCIFIHINALLKCGVCLEIPEKENGEGDDSFKNIMKFVEVDRPLTSEFPFIVKMSIQLRLSNTK